MSRVGRKPVSVPKGVEVNVSGTRVSVKGPKGQLSFTTSPTLTVTQEKEALMVKQVTSEEGRKLRHKETKLAGALWGMTRSRLQALVEGVSTGFTKELELQGIGFRAALKGKDLEFSLGFSHPVKVALPEGIQVKVEKDVKITLTGANKELLGEIAARIRSIRPPDVYQGKGVRYQGEYVRKKVGKSAAAKTAGGSAGGAGGGS